MSSHIKGIVIKGKGEARTLGYPTANIEYEATQSPDSGVWACYVTRGAVRHEALAVIGMWRQSNGLASLETHILDFDQNLYGSELSVELVEKIRDLEKFTGVEALIERIKEDIIGARKTFDR